MLPMKDILTIIQTEIFTGCDFLSKIGMSIFVLLIAVEFIKAAIDATSGRGFNVDKILYLYLFMAVFYMFLPELQAVLKKYAYDGCTLIYADFGGKSLPVKPASLFYGMSHKMYMSGMGGAILQMFASVKNVLVLIFSLLIALIVSIVIDILIISTFLSFEIIIAAAPFFIPFFMSGEVGHIGKQWVNNILMSMMQLAMLSVVLEMIARLNEFAVEYYSAHTIGKGILKDMYVILFIPLLGLGLTWQALSLAKMMFPPSGGFVGTAIGAPVAAAVGYAGHTAARVVTGGR
jgi:hypothetical protein